MLTNEQINYLFDFCKKHYVQYYDVQVELVDHLVNAIEEKMLQHPQWDFEIALAHVFKSFGHSGFAPLVKEKQKAVLRQNRKLLWHFFKDQISWPKILIGLTAFALFYTLLSLPVKEPALIVFMGVLVVSTIAVFAEASRLNRQQRKSGRKFLLVNLAGILPLTYMPLNIFNIVNPLMKEHAPHWLLTGNVVGYLIVSFIFACYVMMTIVSYRTIQHVKGVLIKNYPEVFKTA